MFLIQKRFLLRIGIICHVVSESKNKQFSFFSDTALRVLETGNIAKYHLNIFTFFLCLLETSDHRRSKYVSSVSLSFFYVTIYSCVCDLSFHRCVLPSARIPYTVPDLVYFLPGAQYKISALSEFSSPPLRHYYIYVLVTL